MTKAQYFIKPASRIRQGDVLSEVECIRLINERDGVLTIEKIVYPFVVVMTQDCDLNQDFFNREKCLEDCEANQDKFVQTVLVAPLYNADQVQIGTHLSDLSIAMRIIPKKSEWDRVRSNNMSRYHYLEFPDFIPIVNSVVDFKHFFTVSRDYLDGLKKRNFVCSIKPLYRESLCQRFSFYLSRIALPD